MDSLPDPSEWDPFTKVRSHQGNLPGLEDRSGYIERMKVWCIPAFLDGYCYTILTSPDEKETYLRKLVWRQYSHNPDWPFFSLAEKKVSIDFLNQLSEKLAAISMNPFRTSSDQILDAALVGISFANGDTSVDLSWMGSFEDQYKDLERWMSDAKKQFARFLPDATSS